MPLLGTRLVSIVCVALLTTISAVLLTSSANAGGDHHLHGPSDNDGDRHGVEIRDLDDLAGLPCATETDNPGRVLLEYGPSTQTVGIYCQVGEPSLTISIDRPLIPTPAGGIATTGGVVAVDPPGTVCDSADLDADERSCEPITYDDGTLVTLTVTPDAGSRFTGWVESAGTCRGLQNPCTVTMDRDRRVSATLAPLADL